MSTDPKIPAEELAAFDVSHGAGVVNPCPFLFTPTVIQNKAFKVFKGAATFVLFYGGSRSGKTFLAIVIMIARALMNPFSRHLIVRHRFNHAKQSLWYDTIPKVLRVVFPKAKFTESKSDWFIKFPNGAEIWVAGLDDKERVEKILGNEYLTIYVNEASQVSYDAFSTLVTRLAQKIVKPDGREARLKMLVDCNPPSKSHWIYTLFFKLIDPTSREKKDPAEYAVCKLNPADNLANIGANYLKMLASLPSRARKRFLAGEFTDDVEGALFKQEDIDRDRIGEARELVRIGVAIDPATTVSEGSDETGIIVGGVDVQKPAHAYILADLSGRLKPSDWARRAIQAYYAFEADFIIAESNQGGDMVRQTIHSIDPNVNVRLVRATRGKITRAEPVSAFYEQGRVHHVGDRAFITLEEQLTTFTGDPNQKSPDRLDALVWLLNALLIQSTNASDAIPMASG